MHIICIFKYNGRNEITSFNFLCFLFLSMTSFLPFEYILLFTNIKYYYQFATFLFLIIILPLKFFSNRH